MFAFNFVLQTRGTLSRSKGPYRREGHTLVDMKPNPDWMARIPISTVASAVDLKDHIKRTSGVWYFCSCPSIEDGVLRQTDCILELNSLNGSYKVLRDIIFRNDPLLIIKQIHMVKGASITLPQLTHGKDDFTGI